jgi:hypothetical protein
MLSSDNKEDARARIPGFVPSDGFSTQKSKRRLRMVGDDNSPVKMLDLRVVPNPLDPAEQKKKTKANLGSNPAKMVYFPHTKDERERCAKIMVNNASQALVAYDQDIIAVADHKLQLLSADPDLEVRAAVADKQEAGYSFYNDEKGEYDEHAISWWCDEFFYPGAFIEVDITDKAEFISLYSMYSNGAFARHRTQRHTHLTDSAARPS